MLLLAQLSSTLQEASKFPSEQCRHPSLVKSKGDGGRGAGCLHAAIIVSNVCTLRSLLNDGCDPNDAYHGKTPLTLCMCFGDSSENVERVKMLISYGANVNLHNPLHIACQRGLSSIIDILINNGASTESVEQQNGCTPLQYTLDQLRTSTCSNRISKLRNVALNLLQYPQVDVTNCGLHGRSPLQLAVLTSQSLIILAIISKGGSQIPQHDIQVALELIDNSFTGTDAARQNIVTELSNLMSTQSCLSLQELARIAVRGTLSRRLSRVKDLPCSRHIKRIILHDNARTDCSWAKASDFLKLF